MIKVCGIKELSDIKENEFDHIISIVDDEHTSKMIAKTIGSKNRHIFIFDDITDKRNPEAPTKEHIKSILELFLRKEHDRECNILIHCHGGISRSTAVAIMYNYVIKKLSIKCSYESLKRTRPQMWPNELIIEYIDELLNLNGELITYDTQWKKDNLGIYWSRPPIRIKK